MDKMAVADKIINKPDLTRFPSIIAGMGNNLWMGARQPLQHILKQISSLTSCRKEEGGKLPLIRIS